MTQSARQVFGVASIGKLKFVKELLVAGGWSIFSQLDCLKMRISVVQSDYSDGSSFRECSLKHITQIALLLLGQLTE